MGETVEGGCDNISDMTGTLRVLPVLLALVFVPPATGESAIDREPACDEPLPAETDVRGVTDDGKPVTLDALFLLDGISTANARAITTKIAETYGPAGIKLRATYRTVRFNGREVVDLLAQAKKATRGTRPRGVDVVHTLTTKDLRDGDVEGLVGLADCIGGVRYPDRAYSISEVTPALADQDIGPVAYSSSQPANTASHEIGHLLGARHENANCAEGASDSRGTTISNPCTVMSAVAPTSDVIGIVESTVVRGFANAYARP